jgi:hypothetical protein
MFDRYQWLIPGLFQGWDCIGITWWDKDTVLLSCQHLNEDDELGEKPTALVWLSTECKRDTKTKASAASSFFLNLLGFGAACKTTSNYIKAIKGLYIKADPEDPEAQDEPLHISGGGLAVVRNWLYVSDDSGPFDAREHKLYLFYRGCTRWMQLFRIPSPTNSTSPLFPPPHKTPS